MPERLFSVFGSYDFYGKSFPGMALVIGIVPLLPEGSLPLPGFFRRFIVFIVVLISIALLGTFLGEAVHTLAIYFEHSIAWFGRRVLNTWKWQKGDSDDGESDSGPPVTRLRSSEESLPDDENEELLEIWKDEIRGWFHDRYIDIVFILLSHRKLFELHLTSYLDIPNPAIDSSMPEVSFTHRKLLQKVTNDLGVKTYNDVNDVYPVVTSILSQKGCQRVFRYQARYSFCRGMWMVLFFLSLSYWFVLDLPLRLIPQAFQYQSYLASLSPNEIGMASRILFVLSGIFAIGSGNYKRHYIKYLAAELFTVDEIDGNDDSSGQYEFEYQYNKEDN